MDIDQKTIGSYVYYISLGICRIIETVIMDDNSEYVVLMSINERNPLKVYVPLNNEAQLAKICTPLTKDDVLKVIKAKYPTIEWNNNKRERQETFNAILHSNNFIDIIALIKCLSKKSEQLKNEKKRLSTFDSEILQKALYLLDETIAFALNIPLQEAKNLFNEKVMQS